MLKLLIAIITIALLPTAIAAEQKPTVKEAQEKLTLERARLLIAEDELKTAPPAEVEIKTAKVELAKARVKIAETELKEATAAEAKSQGPSLSRELGKEAKEGAKRIGRGLMRIPRI